MNAIKPYISRSKIGKQDEWTLSLVHQVKVLDYSTEQKAGKLRC